MSSGLLENKNVLVAANATADQIRVSNILVKWGAKVDVAINGAEVIDKLKTTNPDLIFLDIQLPELNGYETTRYIRDQLKKYLPIIAMKAVTVGNEEEMCYQQGMNAVVCKPITEPGLRKALKGIIADSEKTTANPYVLGNKSITVNIAILYDVSGNDEPYIL
ncbi:MAG TPA: response regulator, partial [Segetibacter sp.]